MPPDRCKEFLAKLPHSCLHGWLLASLRDLRQLIFLKDKLSFHVDHQHLLK